VSITPNMLTPGDEKVIARELVKLLKSPPKPPEPDKPPTVDVSGDWSLKIKFLAGSSDAHRFRLSQEGSAVTGSHTGDFVTRNVTGTVSGDTVRIRSRYGEEHGDSLDFTFTGTVKGAAISGELDMGEYLKATWTATRGS
jgi:hypothetical protein